MYSGRRYSVQRHIDRKHRGSHTPIPFGDYRVGRRYLPGPRPNFTKKFDWPNEMYHEICRVICERIAEEVVPRTGSGAARQLALLVNLRTHADTLYKQAFSQIMREIL
jgi:hypothetical protein